MESIKPIPAFFMHIQKTAGTSIVNLARQYYGDGVVSHGDFWGRNPKELKNVPFISGHIGYEYAKYFMASRFCFVFFRDPIERILSMYYFCRGQKKDDFLIYKRAHEHELNEFLKAGFTDPLVKFHIWNNQVWQLAYGYTHINSRKIVDFEPEELYKLAVKHLDNFDYIGLTDTFASDQDAILKALGLPESKKIVIENKTLGRPSQMELPESTKELLNELTVLDKALYRLAKSRRQEIRNNIKGDFFDK